MDGCNNTRQHDRSALKLTGAHQPRSPALSSAIAGALPPPGALVLPSIFWALSCVATSLFALHYARGWELGPQTFLISTIYGLGAVLAVWPTAYFARLFTNKRSMWRLALLCFLLVGFTTFLTAIILALQHRVYFSQWHGEPLSKIWLWQQAFTGGAAVYTYVVLGLRLYLPVGLLALFVTSWWLNRLPD